MNQDHFLVVGAPRTGFTLLISVLNELLALRGQPVSCERQVFNRAVALCGVYLDQFVTDHFVKRVGADNVIYNGEFKALTGGPKWIDSTNHGQAGVRKYVGLKDNGDFMVGVYFPREVLDWDRVVHSHYNPELWIGHEGYARYAKFSSLRNPVGVVNSGVFSLNALTSEYVTRYASHYDETQLRESVATYKLSDMELVKGLAQFVIDYLQSYEAVRDQFYEMKWENLILNPVPTIQAIADQAQLSVSPAQASAIWGKLDHVNLPQFHKHNYRTGKGVVGDWKNSLINEHLELFRDMGLLEWNDRLGYDSVQYLDESKYNPFQKRIQAAVRKGEIIRSVDDYNIFTFAWNKSNIARTSHGVFKRFDRQGNVHLERSCLKDDSFLPEFSEQLAAKVDQVNAMLCETKALIWNEKNGARLSKSIGQIARAHFDIDNPHTEHAVQQLVAEVNDIAMVAESSPGVRMLRRYVRAIKRRITKEHA